MSQPDNADYFHDRPTKEDLSTPLDFDPKIQWHKVLKKLNKYHHDDTQEEDDSVDEKDPVNNVYEMQKIEDDALPSTEEMHRSSGSTGQPLNINTNNNENDKNYFENPFSPVNNQEEDIEARNNWGKTLDKVRLIANLHTIPQKSSDKMMLDPIPTLAPYCPPLFDPPFIALTKNQHGNPWPPVLLPFLKVAITDSELNTQGINQWIFRIELQYGDIKWVIKRTIADFINLHYVLKFKRRINDAVPNPPSFPSQFESWLNSAKGTIIPEERGEERYQIAFKRRRALTQYLQKLILRAHMRASDDICEFFEIRP
ncbi:unnamed protein product [Rhizopus stolonifer]